MVLGELFERFLAVADSRDPVVLALKISRDRIADGFFIFDQKDTTRLIVALRTPVRMGISAFVLRLL